MYTTNRNDLNASIKLVKSSSSRSMTGRTRSFRTANVIQPTVSIKRNRKRRSKSEFIHFSRQAVNDNVSIKQRKTRSYSNMGFDLHKNMQFSENADIQNIRPITLLPLKNVLYYNLPTTKEKWLSKYLQESEIFQSPYCFISLKLQELLHLTHNDKHPSAFRVAMAFELLSTFIKKSNMNAHDTVLIKDILRLTIEGIYSDPLKKPLAMTYHTLIRKKPYFKLVGAKEEKLTQLQHDTEEISEAIIDRMTQFFLKCRKKRSCRAEFIMWKQHTNIYGKLLKYKMQAQRAKAQKIRSQMFYKWKEILQRSKARAIRNIAMQTKPPETTQNVLVTLASTRKRSQSMRLDANESMIQQKERCVTFEGQSPGKNIDDQKRNDNSSIQLIKTNLSYYKKISECRSVFVIEFEKIMKTRLRLMLAREELIQYLKEYEDAFNHKHYSMVLMKDNELQNPWSDKEQRSPLNQLSIEALVLRWINFHLRRFRKMHPDKILMDNGYKRVSNFSRDLDDGKIYWWLLRALGLIDNIPMSFDRGTVKDLYTIITEFELNDGLLITEMDILQGNTANNFAFCVNVMCKYPNITLQNEYVSQHVTELDDLFVEVDNILENNTCHAQFSFSEEWLGKATRQNELMSEISDKYDAVQEKAKDKIKTINQLHYEFDSLLHNAQSYSLKIMSSNRRGIKLLIEDSVGLREIKDLATIHPETFLKFYKFPASMNKLSKKLDEEKALYLRAVIDKCQKCLKENAHIIKHIFEAYAKRNGDAEILNTKELEAFCIDMKLGENLTEFHTKSENGVSKQDFATFLCELCWDQQTKNNPKIFTRAFKRFISSLWQHTKTSLEITNVLGLPQVQQILDKYKMALQLIFRAQSVTDSRSKIMFITKKKWTNLLSKYGIIASDFGTKLAHQTFDVCNNDYGTQGNNSGAKMIYEEFVHGLLAAAMIKNSNIFIPLPHRIEGFFNKLCVAAAGRKLKF